jgi:glyoxylase-like metal-dependent hydrolase (beta-lactamase superfamily II)
VRRFKSIICRPVGCLIGRFMTRTLPFLLLCWFFTAPPLRGADELLQVAPGVFRYRDTCNVYALVRNQKALLIDFGAGGILEHLDHVGARQVDWILHTHFHRDQCQGDRLARARGTRIAVPAAERKYFESAEQMWQQKKVLHLYDLRNEFFAPAEDLAVDRGLEPGSDFDWEGLKLRVVASPGHTEGSLSYLLDVDGKRLSFCGDLVGSPGKIQTIHDMEWPYVGTRGIAAEIASLNMMRQYAPDQLLPSHGEPTHNVQESIPKLISDLTTIYDEYNWYTYTVRQPFTGVTRITPHVWHVRTQRGGTAYVIVSDSGRAFMWDCNYSDLDDIADIQKRTGFKQIDFIALSHYHDDHLGGVNEIKKRYGAKFWAMRHMVDVLEHPTAYNLPCLWHEPTGVDRILEDREAVTWEGIPLQFFYLPGQTEYTEGLLLQIDGKRILFDGDNIAYPVPGRPMLGHYVARNYQRLDGGHIYCAKKFLELAPDFIAPNHFEWIPATQKILQSYLTNAEQMKEAFGRLLDQPDPMFGLDNNWLSVYPYQMEAAPGDSVKFEVRYRNWLYAESTTSASFRVPAGWTIEPSTVQVHAAPKSQSVASVTLHIPRTVKQNHRYVITLDASRDGRRLGEITETLINISPMKAH